MLNLLEFIVTNKICSKTWVCFWSFCLTRSFHVCLTRKQKTLSFLPLLVSNWGCLNIGIYVLLFTHGVFLGLCFISSKKIWYRWTSSYCWFIFFTSSHVRLLDWLIIILRLWVTFYILTISKTGAIQSRSLVLKTENKSYRPVFFRKVS